MLSNHCHPESLFAHHAGRWELLAEELLKWNKVHNLTGHTCASGVMIDLILDSLHLAPLLKGINLLDIGSGAGFPCLPLAVALPDLRVTSLEPRAKRVSFQRRAAWLLGLGSRFKVVCARGSNHQSLPQRFGSVTVRAVGTLRDSLALGAAQVEEEGVILLPRALKDHSLAIELGLEVHSYQLPKPYGDRVIVIKRFPTGVSA